MSTKSRKKVGFSDDVKGGSGEHESRSRSRSRFRERRSRSQDVRSTSKKENIPKKRDHSLIALVRTGSRNSVRSLVRLFETVGGMNEGRKSQIVLPDERRLDLLIQPKLTARDLLDLVSSHFKLKEKEYFGLSFLDETGHYNWLNLEKRVLEHDLPKKSGFLVLYFAVRFYVASISTLRDIATVELFYLNAKQAVFKGQVESDSDTIFELAAHVLQATHGDYVDDETTKADLKKLPVIPTSALREHPSISFCESRVIEYYKKLVGSTRGLSIVNYLSIIESLPTYGIHYYEVKDKKDHPWWLGLSYKGIAVYDKNDKAVPRKIFTWKQLENLYYRDKKFSIEVHDTRRVVHTLSSFNLYEDAIREPLDESDELSDAISDPTTQVSVSRRTFGPGNVVVHAWFGITPQLTKCIWSMAVAQHQFYLDRKHSKSNLPPARSVSEIAAELSRSTSSLQGSIGSDNISRSGSSASLPSLTTSRFDLNFDPNVDTIKVQREMFSALKARKEALEETLKKKTEELKRLCIEEGELTGCLSTDFPILPGETLPVIRKRMGTGFSLASKVGANDKCDDAISQLELEYELQKQITSAAQKLSQDKSVSKYVRKQRRQSLHKAQSKLKDMEKKLVESKGQAGKSGFLSPTVPSYDVPKVSPVQSPELPQRNRKIDLDTCNNEHVPPMIQRSATTRDLSPTDAVPPLSPTLSSPQLTSYNKSAYKNQMYLPTLSSRSASAGSNMSNQSEYENVQGYNRFDTGSQDSGFSSNNNMYNLMTQRTSHYESTDEIKTPTNIESSDNIDTVFDDRKKYSSKHGSLDGSFRKASNTQHNYGSLERNVHRRERQWSYRDRQHSDSDANSINLTDLEPSKFGSKRNSQSEYDLSTSKTMIEVPVQHEEMDKKSVQHRRFKSSPWEETTLMEPSPVIQSPEQSDTYEKHCYSPRLHEGSFFTNKNPSSNGNDQNSYPRQSESPRMGKQSSALVTVTKIQPHHNVEVVSKPFEMSDFYKYSEKIRRQRMIDQYQQQLMGGSRCSSPSQQSTDSGDNSSQHSGSNMSYHHHHPQSYSSQSGLSPSHSMSSVHSPYRPGTGSVPSQGSTTNYVGHQGSPFMSHKRDYEQSYSSSQGSPKFQAIKEHSTHVQYTMKTPSGARVYKSVQTKHTHYQPLTPQKCDPIRNQAGSPVNSSSRNFNHNSRRTEKTVERGGGLRSYSPNVVYDGGSRASPGNPCDSSFALDKESVASDFGEEMLAWIDKDSNTKNPSFV